MSSLIFPSLLGFDIGIKRTPVYSTLVQTSPSGKEVRASFQATPRWKYEIPVNFLRMLAFSAQTVIDEMKTLQAFFHTMKGRYDSFLYADPYSNTANVTPFGTGTGTQTQFQLLDIEGFPIYDITVAPQIYVNGVLKTYATDYNFNATCVITFTSAPANGAALTWSGPYYRRCRFDMDEAELEQIVSLVWGNGTISLISVK